jgi:hypothetical protein
MKKWLLIGFGLVCIIILGVVLCLQTSKTKVLNIKREDVIRIYIVDGNTGSITDVKEEYFDEIYDALDSLNLNNKKKVDSTGWNKKVVICSSNSEDELIINSSTHIIVSGYFYEINSEVGENILYIINKVSS